MLFDCFSYWDEDTLLELRLNILNDLVDFFVIVEGNKTWQNNPKNLKFNIDKFEKYKKKIKKEQPTTCHSWTGLLFKDCSRFTVSSV